LNSQSDNQLTGWYVYRMLFMVMIIVGITQSVKCFLTAQWIFCCASFLILAVGLSGLWVTVKAPVVSLVGLKMSCYEFPFFNLPPSHEFQITEVESMILIRGHCRWKIQIKLQSGVSIDYSPSQLEIELTRIITFFEQSKECIKRVRNT